MGAGLVRSFGRIFTGLKDYDALNKVESNNYDMEYYVSKENLVVTFTEELKDEIETMRWIPSFKI